MQEPFNIQGITGNMLHMSKDALAIFRKNILKNIGQKNSKNFFFNFGWELGAYDASIVIQREDISIVEKIRLGPLYHIQNGHISGYTSKKLDIKQDENGNVVSLFIHGIWFDSFEAKKNLELLGTSDQCTCSMLSGYTSGFLSKICNKEIVVKELKCIGKGDEYCEFISKNIEQWDHDELERTGYFNQRSIAEELSATYDELYSQKELINNVVAFQTKMMEQIINSNYLESILKLTYETLKLPVIVENSNNQLINFYGITDEEYKLLKEDFLKHTKSDNNYLNYLSKMTHVQTSLQNRLVAPLIIEDLTLGYCSFIFDESDRHNVSKYQLFFDSIINTVLLFLLNQKAKFESIDRMKSSFFDDILDKRYSKEDIISRGIYINMNFEIPYYIIALNFNISSNSLTDEHTFISEIHDYIYKLSEEYNFKYLITNRNNNFILYLQTIDNYPIDKVIMNIYSSLTKNSNYSRLKIGVSHIGRDIVDLDRHYQEAVTSLKLTIKENISYFKDLGLIGIFINQSDKETIKTYAEEELGELYKQKNLKNTELLRTAYYFLLSGGNYKETMYDLSISLTGLRYRITKLEKVLNKNLRNPNEGYHLLILLKALIILNELDITI